MPGSGLLALGVMNCSAFKMLMKGASLVDGGARMLTSRHWHLLSLLEGRFFN